MEQGEIEKFLSLFHGIILNHLKAKATKFYFTANNPLQVMINNKIVPNPKVKISSEVMVNALRQVVANATGRKFRDVTWHDINNEVGARLNFDILQVVNEKKANVILFIAHIEKSDAGVYRLVLEHEPEIKVGYGKLVDPSQISDEGQFAKWFDDFAIRVMALKNPTPKDLILNPNKEHPYVTITGGLREIKDVFLRPKTGVTERIAKTLIKASGNPAVMEQVKENYGKLDMLDIDLAYKTSTNRRFRVNIADVFDMENEHNPLITMRILPAKPWLFEMLQMPNVDYIKEWVRNLKMGLFLIAGTTGSGKSTTMCAIIDYVLKSKSINLLTIENPIETMFPARYYPKSIISQRELGKHAINLHTAMESCVRQTLNVAMVGEIRNARDCMMALELAESGHLIFATIHAGSVGESIGRMVEMFPADQEKKIRDMLAAHYKVGLAQQLVIGSQGQVEAILEMMKTNEAIRELIEQKQTPGEEKTMTELIELYSHQTGMQSLDQCLCKLMLQDRIDEDTLMFNSPNPDAVVYRQEKLGIQLSAKWDSTGHSIQEAMKAAGLMREKAKKKDDDDFDIPPDLKIGS